MSQADEFPTTYCPECKGHFRKALWDRHGGCPSPVHIDLLDLVAETGTQVRVANIARASRHAAYLRDVIKLKETVTQMADLISFTREETPEYVLAALTASQCLARLSSVVYDPDSEPFKVHARVSS